MTTTLYGAEVSYFTGKVRAYLRWAAIPFEEVLSTADVFVKPPLTAPSSHLPRPSSSPFVVPPLSVAAGVGSASWSRFVDALSQARPNL